jgi:hypothetical protein
LKHSVLNMIRNICSDGAILDMTVIMDRSYGA